MIPFQEDRAWSVNQSGSEGAESNNMDDTDDKAGSNSVDKVGMPEQTSWRLCHCSHYL